MDDIYIPRLLKMPNQKEEIKFNNTIENLATLTPVKGILTVSHGGNFLNVDIVAETIVTLICDRCLQSFNHRLKVETSELILLEHQSELNVNISLEREISIENLSETLNPQGYFEVENWIYQQISLAMPIRKLCGNDCNAPTPKETEQIIDNRWATLQSLKSLINEQ